MSNLAAMLMNQQGAAQANTDMGGYNNKASSRKPITVGLKVLWTWKKGNTEATVLKLARRYTEGSPSHALIEYHAFWGTTQEWTDVDYLVPIDEAK